MRVDLTLESGSATRCDVAVCGPPDLRLEHVTAELRELARVSRDAALWSNSSLLQGSARFGFDGLKAGATLHVGARPAPAHARTNMLALRVVGGCDSGSAIDLPIGSITVGRAADCDLVLTDPDASRRHIRLDVTQGDVVVTDLGSTNRSLINGLAVADEGTQLRAGDILRIGDSFLALTGPTDPPARAEVFDGRTVITRTTRRSDRMDTRTYTLPVDPQTRARTTGTFLPTAVALASAVVVSLVLRSVQLLVLAAAMPLATAGMAMVEHTRSRRVAKRAVRDRSRTSDELHAAIERTLHLEAIRRRQATPDAGAIAQIATGLTSRIWERRQGESDLLTVRVGTGDLPSDTKITRGGVPIERWVRAVPVLVNLAQGPTSIAGPRSVCERLASFVVCQLCVLCSPVDVEIIGVLAADSAQRWHWMRWLPHLRRPPATSEAGRREVAAHLLRIVEQRRAQHATSSGWRGPWLVILVDIPIGAADASLFEALTPTAAEVGITAIHLGSRRARTGTHSTVSISGETGSRLVVHQNGTDTACVADLMNDASVNVTSRALAHLVDPSVDARQSTLTDCRLLDLLGLPNTPEGRDIEARWRPSHGRPTTILGADAMGPVEVDLVGDGPHALIAGTTGAGKSELLQALVVGLAAHHPPESTSFVLIDYKGGAAFSECARLPHVAGLVTDLDASLTGRALQAFDCELRRREALFAKFGAPDLDAYRAVAEGATLPRLIIVIDEFAALAEDAPDLLRGLVGVAQRGRSLGVHLILATQRPAGVVSADIRANTSLRIALRVNDAHESVDVIGTDEAALLEPERPGQAIISRGSVRTPMQIARVSGGPPPEAMAGVYRLGPWREPIAGTARGHVDCGAEQRDLGVLVDAIVAAAHSTGRSRAPSPWLAPLPSVVTRAELPPSPRPTVVHMGLVDLPGEQAQPPAAVDLAVGATIVIAGAARSGRTTAALCLALQAVEQLDATSMHLDAIGPSSSGLADLPQCGTAVDVSDFDRVASLVGCIKDELPRRRRRPAGIRMLIIDGWEEFLAASDQADHGRTAEALLDIARQAGSAALTLVVTGHRAALGARLAGTASATYVLRMADRADFSLAGIDRRAVPLHMPPGRALLAPRGEQVQFALPTRSCPDGPPT